jgi:hypothetical protein
LFAKVINDRRIDIEAELKTKLGKKNARSMTAIKSEAAHTLKQKPQRKNPLHWAADKGVKS